VRHFKEYHTRWVSWKPLAPLLICLYKPAKRTLMAQYVLFSVETGGNDERFSPPRVARIDGSRSRRDERCGSVSTPARWSELVGPGGWRGSQRERMSSMHVARTMMNQQLRRVSNEKFMALITSSSIGVVALLGAQSALTSLFALLTARLLGPSDRGVVVLIATTSSLLMLLGSLGVATGGRMLLSRGESSYPLGRHYRLTLRLGLVHIATSALLGLPLLIATHSWRGTSVGLCLIVYSVGMLVAYFERETLHGLQRHRTAITIDLSTATVQMFGLALLLLVHAIRLVSVLELMSIAIWMQVSIAVVVTRKARRVGEERAEMMRFSKVLVLSLPALIAALAQAYVVRGDRLMLGILADTRSVGIYGTAATIAEAIWLVPLGLSQVVFSKSANGDVRAIARYRRISLAFSVAASVVVVGLAPVFVKYMLGVQYEQAVALIRLLTVAAVAMGVFFVETAVLNGQGDLKVPAKAASAGALVMLILCFVLIPHLGAFGAAWATVVSYALLGLLAWLAARRRLNGLLKE